MDAILAKGAFETIYASAKNDQFEMKPMMIIDNKSNKKSIIHSINKKIPIQDEWDSQISFTFHIQCLRFVDLD
jgi:hypothetical protein